MRRAFVQEPAPVAGPYQPSREDSTDLGAVRGVHIGQVWREACATVSPCCQILQWQIGPGNPAMWWQFAQ